MANNELKAETLSATTLAVSGNLAQSGGTATINATGAVAIDASTTLGICTTAGTPTISRTGVTTTIAGDLAVSGATPFRKVRAVCTANVANLASFNVSTNTDGVTLVAGDIVLLSAQTTAAQNGPYIVGTVAVGVAPLTRPAWFTTGATVKTGYALEVGGEGTVFKNTTWKTMLAADSFVVDTTDGKFYPLMVSGQNALVGGVLTITTVPIFSTKTNVNIRRTTPVSTNNTHEYVMNGNPTPGVIGTASVTLWAAQNNGSLNSGDGSTINWTIFNQG